MSTRKKRPSPKVHGPFLKRIKALPERVDPTRYPFNIPAFSQGIDLTITSNVTFFVGENGSGKSTLLEAIAENSGFNPQGGGRDHNVAGRHDPSDLASALRLAWSLKVTDGFFMRAESFYNFASYLEQAGSTFQRYGGRKLHDQSHGESFLALFSNFFDRGIYILDEPEAALSPQRQLSFLSIMYRLEKTSRAQFLVSTHSPIILAYPGAVLLSLDSDTIQQVQYEDTDHYRVTKQFLASPDRYFKHLFSKDSDDDDDDET
jgi:predicted ATPase